MFSVIIHLRFERKASMLLEHLMLQRYRIIFLMKWMLAMQTLKFKKTSVRNLPNGYINLSTTFPTKVFLYFFLYYIFVFSIYIIYTLPYRSISYSTPLNITFLTGLSANKSNIPIIPHTMNSLAPIVTKNIANTPSEP